MLYVYIRIDDDISSNTYHTDYVPVYHGAPLDFVGKLVIRVYLKEVCKGN